MLAHEESLVKCLFFFFFGGISFSSLERKSGYSKGKFIHQWRANKCVQHSKPCKVSARVWL